MVLQLKQSLKLSQQLIMTPQLQQAIKLLQLNRLELLETIHQELETNPVLEETTLEEEEPTAAREPDPADQAEDKLLRDHTAPVEVKEKVNEQEELDWEAYLGEYNSPYQAASSEREDREAVPLENILSAAPDLVDHLQWQLMLSDLNQAERRIGVEIIGNIRPSGYLDASLEEIAAECGSDLAQVEKVLKLIQLFDPVGVAARDLRECLLIQMAQQDLEDSLAWRIVDQGLDQLGNKNYRALAKRFGASLEDIADAVEIISGLDPKPGRAYSSERPQYITPDIYVLKVDDDYVIVLNEDGLPKLKVNSFYRRALTNTELVSDGTREFIQDKLRSAMWLIRSIHQRQRTIYKVTESIVKRQRQFLDQGIAYLKPMVLKDVAEDVEMHESTISRVTTNKYVHTPQGLFELKYFFNSAIQRFHGEALASESVKERIRQIVAAEDQDHPLSDDQIKKILEAENINIARRTVAKYREVLNILPSSKRRRPVLRSR